MKRHFLQKVVISVALSWTDQPGTSPGPVEMIYSSSGNDLDIKIAGGLLEFPYKLDHQPGECCYYWVNNVINIEIIKINIR
jgi:hypothetical protein